MEKLLVDSYCAVVLYIYLDFNDVSNQGYIRGMLTNYVKWINILKELEIVFCVECHHM